MAFTVVYLWAFPYFGAVKSANELPRVLMTQEIVERGTFRLDARMGEMGSRFDLAKVGAHYYPNKAPGVSLLAVPVYAVMKAVGVTSIKASTWAFRVVVVTIPALLFLMLFFRLTSRFADDTPSRQAALVAYGLGSLALPYALLFMSHVPAAVAAGGAFVAAVALVRGGDTRRPDLMAALVGLGAGLAVLLDYQALLVSAAIGGYVLWKAPRRWRAVALVAAGALPSVLALAGYHEACYGSPWKTGYSFAADQAHQQGVLGIIGPNREAMWNALLAPSNGLLVLMPWVLLAVVGGVAIARDPAARARVGAEALVCAVIVAGYVLFLGSLVPEFGRAGWSVGPRYITVAIPFAAWLAAAGFAAVHRWLALRTLAYALVLVGVIVYVVAATTYPHWPEYLTNPLYELSFRLLRAGYAPHAIAGTVWPLYVIAGALAIWLLGLRATTAVAVVIATLIVVSYSRFPRTGPRADRAWKFVTETYEPRR